jgi:hypothetical protein
MTLRPRYSLLTLLLLTAAVAGGMKYWRGPHWAELHDPPTAEEKAAFADSLHLWDFISYYGALDVRYQFTRGWDEQHWHLLEGHTFLRPLIITSPPHDLVNGYPWVLPLKNGWQPISYWVAGVGKNDKSIYLLAENQQVYCLEEGYIDERSQITLREIELSQIADEAVRARLEVEIRQLQDLAKSAKLGP